MVHYNVCVSVLLLIVGGVSGGFDWIFALSESEFAPSEHERSELTFARLLGLHDEQVKSSKRLVVVAIGSNKKELANGRTSIRFFASAPSCKPCVISLNLINGHDTRAPAAHEQADVDVVVGDV